MKRLNLVLIGTVLLSSSVFAGGLVTNVNGGAVWARTLSRDASTDIDAVYFNPAGLGQLKKGLHISLSNQTIFQTRQITSDYMFLDGAPKTYEAELKAPFFPSIYAAYKMEKLAISAGFNIIGGGGSANFQEGLPSFEIPVASVVPQLNAILDTVDNTVNALMGQNPGFSTVEAYNMVASFEGSSNYMGFQVGATYAINDMISVAVGGRFVHAKNTYNGSLSGVTINPPATTSPIFGTDPMTPGNYLTGVGGYISGAVAGTPYENLPQVQTLLDTLAFFSGVFNDNTADQELSTVQTGFGFTPIVGINLSLLDMVNIGIKYEHHTKIELENETTSDVIVNGQGMFPDGEKTRADLPGMVSAGVQVKPIEKLSASVGFNYFLDKTAYYGVTDENGAQVNNESTINDNAYTFSGSVEYKFLGILGASVGFSTGNLGVNNIYQSDMSYALKSTSIGGGVFVELGKIVTLNAGYVHVMYDDYSNSELSYPLSPEMIVPYNDTYGKKTSIIAIGLDISL